MKTKIKEKVKQLVDSYNTQKKEIQANMKSWNDHPDYSDAYKSKQIEELRQKAERLDKQFNSEMTKIVLEEKKNIIGEPKAKPADYQIMISNALKFLELAGKNLTDDRACEILKPFQDDFETMQLFKPIIIELGSGGVTKHLTKTLGKINAYETIIQDFTNVEQKLNSNLFNFNGGMNSAIGMNFFIDQISEINQLVNSFDAA